MEIKFHEVMRPSNEEAITSITIKEAFNGVTFRTSEYDELYVVMRGNSFIIGITDTEQEITNWFKITRGKLSPCGQPKVKYDHLDENDNLK